ncbi:MAG: PTS sugar transporter subunit IIA [Treponema sp.]|jgi:mannitol/fructose-specific phosphotransferase system IIA component (Ntr-type)|nr:PTS sugar transporter subunit IIA [Treponema sp.]
MLDAIFDPRRINLNLSSRTKNDVLGELIETVKKTDSSLDRQELLNAITMRENKMATIILPGVAVPHGYCSAVHGVIGAIGFSREGIEFDREDRDPVHLFFMLLMDESSREQHLRVLSRLLEMINSATLGEIRGIESSQELYKLLCRY